ncbi:hypothetical protein FSARC_13707 [Fusarium sarcochroum]|uniref:Arginine metabolism regulation protein II n=1 Tax=Fusarium sarcochroum TaxID=1208366 RepID=A0A8H4SZJ2_9HYPO|nr:hypothetical protein FSARC_13707 [Fusarium sarcochroum]
MLNATKSNRDASPSGPGQGSRRHIYTAETRSSMAAAISSSLSPSSVGPALLDIESHSRNTDSSQSSAITIGPFGLFDATPVPETTPATTLTPEDSAHASITLTGEANEPRPSSSLDVHDHGLSLRSDYGALQLAGDWDNHLAWTDLFALDFEVAPDIPPVENLDLTEPSTPTIQAATMPETPFTIPLDQDHSQPSINNLPLHSLSRNEVGLIDLSSPEIPFLLRNFEAVVMPRMASVPLTEKFAWGPMHLELALHTLAEITMLKRSTVNKAKLTNLYGLISTSSYHLYLMNDTSYHPPGHWLQLSQKALRDASIHFRQCFESGIQGPKTAKYKEQLIALQTLMGHAWVVSDQTETRRIQIEAERLVRFRGLAERNISRRIRLLHHVYTWSRIVGESTYVLHDYRKFQQAMGANVLDASTTLSQPGIGYIQEDTGLDDFLRVQYHYGEADASLDSHKDAQTGNQDIHLEDPRHGIEDQFHVIYGIPEQWLSLLSRTTRLANWMDATEIPHKLRDDRLKEKLSRQAQSLEDAVCDFFHTHKMSTNIDANKPPNVCMFRCLTASLLIFFYRRIRNVNPLVLQTYVDEVIQGLEIFDASLVRHKQPGPGTAWAAFMAGCEAMGDSRRKKLLQWIERAFDICKFQSYQQAKEIMIRVWERMDQTHRFQREAPRPSWMQISRDLETWLPLS